MDNIMKKTHKKSRFFRFHYCCTMADQIFSSEPHIGNKSITVLQLVLINGERFVAEIVYLEDYNKIIKRKIKNKIGR